MGSHGYGVNDENPMTIRDLPQGRRILFTMLTALDLRYAPGPKPPLIPALRARLGGWPGIGRIVAGMSCQGFDLQLTRQGHSTARVVGTIDAGCRLARSCSNVRGPLEFLVTPARRSTR
jgi:hypothetical protein